MKTDYATGCGCEFGELQSIDSLWNAYVTWSEHTVRLYKLLAAENK